MEDQSVPGHSFDSLTAKGAELESSLLALRRSTPVHEKGQLAQFAPKQRAEFEALSSEMRLWLNSVELSFGTHSHIRGAIRTGIVVGLQVFCTL